MTRITDATDIASTIAVTAAIIILVPILLVIALVAMGLAWLWGMVANGTN